MRQWNRQPFYHETLPDGRPNATPLPFVIRDNFLISNYGSGYGVDNDDGSAWFEIFGNVLVGGSGLKSDYSGHDKDWHSNLGIGLGLPCGAFTTYKAGHEDKCWNNTFVSPPGPTGKALGNKPWVMATYTCDIRLQDVEAGQARCIQPGQKIADMHSNRVYNQNASAPAVTCGQLLLSATNFSQTCGIDVGTQTERLPTVPEIEAMARRWIRW